MRDFACRRLAPMPWSRAGQGGAPQAPVFREISCRLRKNCPRGRKKGRSRRQSHRGRDAPDRSSKRRPRDARRAVEHPVPRYEAPSVAIEAASGIVSGVRVFIGARGPPLAVVRNSLAVAGQSLAYPGMSDGGVGRRPRLPFTDWIRDRAARSPDRTHRMSDQRKTFAMSPIAIACAANQTARRRIGSAVQLLGYPRERLVQGSGEQRVHGGRSHDRGTSSEPEEDGT